MLEISLPVTLCWIWSSVDSLSRPRFPDGLDTQIGPGNWAVVKAALAAAATPQINARQIMHLRVREWNCTAWQPIQVYLAVKCPEIVVNMLISCILIM